MVWVGLIAFLKRQFSAERDANTIRRGGVGEGFIIIRKDHRKTSMWLMSSFL
jgi:hypothetical protein